MMHGSQSLLAAGLLFFDHAIGDVIPFPFSSGPNGYGGTVAIPAACSTALNQTLTGCDSSLQALAGNGVFFSPNSTGNAATLCVAPCNASMTSYHSAVASACGSTEVFSPLLGDSWAVDLLQAYYNIVCGKDTGSGEFCFDWLAQQYAIAAANGASDLTDLPRAVLCSDCQVSYFRNLQSTPFLGYTAIQALQWSTIQQTCGLNLPSDVSSGANLTYNPANSTSSAGCTSGKTYTVANGDTCESIAAANSVAQGTLWSINNLFPGCTGMSAGQSICLPNSCATYTALPDDTCWSVAAANNITFAQFLGYNPAIDRGCTNLNSTVGAVVCVSSPDGTWSPTYPPASNSSGAGNGAGEYAVTAVAPPGPTPFGTTPNCGGFYQVQVADTCERISVAAGVSVALFELVNPSIDDNCFNLVPDLWYCVHPVYGWNITSGTTPPGSSTTVAPPAPTPPGTTNQCFAWHVIVANDSCSVLQNTLGVSIAQLVFWNPDLKSDCSNLLLGEAYCVNGPPLSTTTTATSVTITSTTTGPTITASSCSSTYTVKSGDFCFSIYTQFNLTEAQFRALNPSLDANCDLNIGQVLCVAGPPQRTTTITAPPTTTSSGSGTCTTTYVVQSGDSCFAIWTQFGLTEAQFRALNPSLDTNCDLNIGQVLCVGGATITTSAVQPTSTSASTCKTTYTVKSGDFCFAIYSEFGLTEAQFRALNPSLDANCDLDIGQVLCVA